MSASQSPTMYPDFTGPIPSWVRAIFVLGVPSAIALFLVWSLVGDLSHQVQAIASNVESHEQARTHDMDIEAAFLFAICLNTANNDTDRARCAIPMDAVTTRAVAAAPSFGRSARVPRSGKEKP